MSGVDLIISGANVVTLDPAKPRAQAVAISNGKIVDVGTNQQILNYATDETKIIDLNGHTVVPGLIDCHVHMLDFGQSLRRLDLRNVGSIEEMQSKLNNYARSQRHGWILGRGWDQDRFDEKRYPSRWDLDAAVNDRPVFLTRVCGHIGVVNSKALELAGINREMSLSNRQIDRDGETGELTGILREESLELVHRVIPKLSSEEIEESCLLACHKAVEAGLTSVNWIVSSTEELRAIQKLDSEGQLPIRVYIGFPVEFLNHLTGLGLLTGFGSNKIKIGFIKVLADGSLGGHTAALYQPYNDQPDTRGIMLYTQRKLNKIIHDAHRAGLQMAVHAIGDRALGAALKAFRRAFKKSPRNDSRHRIEHCSVLNPTLIKAMSSLGIIASVQPHFVVSDFWVTKRVGKERARWVYPFKSLIHEGITVAAGSDCPVEPINPLLGMWAAVTRTDSCDENVTAEEALRMYTLNAAYACFEEDRKGSIEAGKLADFTVLSDDPCVASPEKIKDIAVEMVIIDGRTIYER